MRARRACGALAAGVLLALAIAVPAAAVPDTPNPQTGPANGEGAWAYCVMWVNKSPTNSASGTTNYRTSIKCNFGPTDLNVNTLSANYRPGPHPTGYSGLLQGVTCGYGSSAEAARIISVKPGGIYCSQVNTVTNAAIAAFWPNTIGATGAEGCYVTDLELQIGTTTTGAEVEDFGVGGANLPEVQLICAGTNPSAEPYPDPYWPGGSGSTSGDGADDGFSSDSPPDENTESGSGDSCGAWWHIGCYVEQALLWAFVPDSGDIEALFDDLSEDTEGRFPISLIEEASDAFYFVTGGLLDGTGACNPILLSMPMPPPWESEPNWTVRLPSFYEGCTYDSQTEEWGDLFGYRSVLRQIMEIALIVVVLVRLVGAFSPAKQASEIEPDL